MDLDRLLSLWWEPKTPEKQHSGLVSRDADGAITIELVGTLSDSPFPMHDPEPEILHGLGNAGPLFTARRAMRSGAHIGMPGFSTEVFRPLSMIVGGHVDETARYSQALLRTSFLADWLQLSGILVDVKRDTDASKGSVGVRYEWPAVQTSHAAPGVSVSTWTGHQGQSTSSGYAINEDVALEIALETAVPLDDLVQNYVMPLVDLVSFGTGRSNAIDRLTVRTPSVVTMVGDKGHQDDLDYLTAWVAKPPKEREHLLDHHMNFSLRDAAMGFDELVRRWFALHETLRLALAPFFGLLYAPPTYVDLKLVSISQALEAYDRASGRSRRAMSAEEFARFKKILMDTCPEEHRDFLTQKLGYLNELSQVDRTNYLVERARVPLQRLVAKRPTFAVDFIDSRNAKTHPDKDKNAMSGLQMYDLTATATYLFAACVMLDLGFEENLCANLFERQPAYVHLADNPPPAAS
jgi:ApeA N-terminal domain 1